MVTFAYGALMLLIGVVCSPACRYAENGSAREPKLLIEVFTDRSIVNYPPGKTLTLRVLDNAEVEFENYRPHGPDNPGFPFESVQSRSTITPTQLETITAYLLELDAEETTSYYAPRPRALPSIDDYVTVTINYESKDGPKQIVAKENESAIDWQGIGSPALKKLMPLTYQISAEKRRLLPK